MLRENSSEKQSPIEHKTILQEGRAGLARAQVAGELWLLPEQKYRAEHLEITKTLPAAGTAHDAAAASVWTR